MLATPEAADWAEHPAARAGKLEKRGRLKDDGSSPTNRRAASGDGEGRFRVKTGAGAAVFHRVKQATAPIDAPEAG